MKKLSIVGISISAAALILAAPSLSIPASAQEGAKGGGKKLIELNQVKSEAQVEGLKKGDLLAMVCSKCKSVQVNYITTESKEHVKVVRAGQKHLCPGCKSTIEVVGHGKAKTDEVKHICKACGDDSAFCCATKPGTGVTAGMEKEKK